MSLSFSGSTDAAKKTGYTAVFDVMPITFWGWFFPTSIAAASACNLITGRGTATGNGPSLKFASANTGDLRLFVNGGTNLNYITNDTPLATVNRWYFVAGVFAFSVNGSHIYVGRKGIPLVESGYSTHADGVTMTTQGDGCISLGSQMPTPSNPFPGKIGPCGVHSGALSISQLDEIRVNFWRAQAIGTPLGLWLPGYSGVGTQTDLSGNSGDLTVTGATQSDDGNVLPRYASAA